MPEFRLAKLDRPELPEPELVQPEVRSPTPTNRLPASRLRASLRITMLICPIRPMCAVVMVNKLLILRSLVHAAEEIRFYVSVRCRIDLDAALPSTDVPSSF